MSSRSKKEEDTIERILLRVSRWLPHQGPLKDFVHHNTLHAFQSFPFFEGCLRASRLYGSWTFFPLSIYTELFEQQKISVSALAEIVQESPLPVAGQLREAYQASDWPQQLLSGRWGEYSCPPGIAQSGLRSRWRNIHNLKLGHRIYPKLFRLLGQYLDQGIAMWEAPQHEGNFFDFVRRLVKSSWLPLRPWSASSVRSLWEKSATEVVQEILVRFLGTNDEALWERYLLEMSLAHPGWSGMAQELQAHPEGLLEARKISLLEFCAVELIAEYAYIHLDLGPEFPPLLDAGTESLGPLPYEPDYQLECAPAEQVAQLWHQAFERTYRQSLNLQLHRHRAQQTESVAVTGAPEFQVFFCLDDREGSMRRHLEEQDAGIETFGFAGFFGVDCAFQGVDDAFPSKHCPAPVHPKHLVREHRVDSKRDSHSFRFREVHSHSQSLVRGFVVSQTLGLWAAVKLALSIFRPVLNPLASSSLQKVDTTSKLSVHREQNEQEEGFFSGYTDEEMAERVGNLLRASGLSAGSVAPLIVFVGHGASSINNPYFSAYDCGACSGRSGGPNARAIALMGNRPEVRSLLARRGLAIPQDTWFVGALHDTTRDEMQFYDVEAVPAGRREQLERLIAHFDSALALNAQERCKRFAGVVPSIDPRDAILAVRRRSVSIFEPRPELNHAGNAACIVGRRVLTSGLFLDRRVFLQSYAPSHDPDGEILAALLAAVIPVCGGINLEYYFSRLDPQVYGAGSKLPHNIQSLIGVINGTEGDLLTGLPTQMTEVHDPVRMLFVVEQKPEICEKAVRAHPAVLEWVDHGWVQLLCWEPSQDRWYHWVEHRLASIPAPQGVTA